MTIGEALHQAAECLTQQSIDDAYLEADILLRHALGLTRAQLYARVTDEAPSAKLDSFHQMLDRRLRHEPTPHIVGHKEFFDLDFYVDRRVLIPRPETELLVERAIDIAQRRWAGACLITDIGTGSGAIAVSLAVHLPQASIFAIDPARDALEVASINCARHAVEDRVKLLLSDTVLALPEPVHLMVANLPYVKDDDLPTLAPEIREWEPLEALAGGPDGLGKIRRFLSEAGARLHADGVILVEMNPEQAQPLTAFARRLFPQAAIRVETDLAHLDRMVVIEVGRMKGHDL
ncbi:MAG: peptide chain release factor N(5)-glutamine methyltransferase [Chloroflexi bacterium]|nr:peptide chain release factor N(5)-glutamine methyltransferase [Chloroflexota bacterium]